MSKQMTEQRKREGDNKKVNILRAIKEMNLWRNMNAHVLKEYVSQKNILILVVYIYIYASIKRFKKKLLEYVRQHQKIYVALEDEHNSIAKILIFNNPLKFEKVNPCQ